MYETERSFEPSERIKNMAEQNVTDLMSRIAKCVDLKSRNPDLAAIYWTGVRDEFILDCGIPENYFNDLCAEANNRRTLQELEINKTPAGAKE